MIGRFSEDIDITIDSRVLPMTADLSDPGHSKTRIKKLLEEADRVGAAYTRDVLFPRLYSGGETISEVKDISIRGEGVIEVVYASLLPSQGYVLPRILIECGARNVHDDREFHEIVSYATEHISAVSFPKAPAVCVQSPVRTFWEKATILHAEYHRPEPRLTDRIARHWYDTAMLAKHSIKERALADISKLQTVATYKGRLYPSGWASYESARAGTLRLVPHSKLNELLSSDYDSMVRAGFFFTNPPTWAEIIKQLAELELDISQESSVGF